MRDPRIDKLAQTLVNFSTQVQPGDNVLIQATDANRELVKALIAEIYRAGGKPFVWLLDAQIERALMLGCSPEQLDPARRGRPLFDGADAGVYWRYRRSQPGGTV